jgi:hypothetical protein
LLININTLISFSKLISRLGVLGFGQSITLTFDITCLRNLELGQPGPGVQFGKILG